VELVEHMISTLVYRCDICAQIIIRPGRTVTPA
jgi:hypothetical protein